MTKLLSDEQKLAIYRSSASGERCIIDFADAIEAAVLEAQGKQEPVAKKVRYGSLLFLAGYDALPNGAKLYAAPVVQPGMVMVPREPTDEYRRLASANGVTFDSVADAAYRAMIAAAEGKK